ncbi:DUF1573 domain-containing protein [Planctomycetes bacterium K23_9]|uniref:DUF1573 domain-containing protein n=1 Tax=Stieleria marina TaxID=1930275 RepID=A0A517P319_9BACT|nr:hypothetical protein K239x_57680 [Planctomycetes bacterium K23_9]
MWNICSFGGVITLVSTLAVAPLLRAQGVLPSAEPQKSNEPAAVKFDKVQLPKQEVDNIPVWATIKASEISKQITVPLGVHFEGAILTGRIVLQNDLSEDVRLGTVTSSCGCTAVKRLADLVKPNSSAPLLTQIRKQKAEKFSEGIRLQYAGKTHEILFSGQIEPRLYPLDHLRIKPDGQGDLLLRINDKTLAPESARFDCVTEGFSIRHQPRDAQTIVLSCHRSDGMPNEIRIRPFFNDKSFPVLSVPITYIGVLRVIPPIVYVSDGKPVRVFATGDIDAFEKSETVQATLALRCSDGSGSVNANSGEGHAEIPKATIETHVKVMPTLVALTFPIAAAIETDRDYKATLTVNDKELTFRVRKRD